MPATPGAERSDRRRFSRHAFRRVVAAVVLALFARQSTAHAWTHCNGLVADRASSAMAPMPHQQRDAGHSGMPDSPAPKQGSNCDHTMPADGCGIGSGCVVAVLGTALVVAAPRAVPVREFLVPAEAPVSLEFAPDVPPPRT
jgi:hypothetical protein